MFPLKKLSLYTVLAVDFGPKYYSTIILRSWLHPCLHIPPSLSPSFLFCMRVEAFRTEVLLMSLLFSPLKRGSFPLLSFQCQTCCPVYYLLLKFLMSIISIVLLNLSLRLLETSADFLPGFPRYIPAFPRYKFPCHYTTYSVNYSFLIVYFLIMWVLQNSKVTCDHFMFRSMGSSSIQMSSGYQCQRLLASPYHW